MSVVYRGHTITSKQPQSVDYEVKNETGETVAETITEDGALMWIDNEMKQRRAEKKGKTTK